ncbi:hypothetical protein P0Y35_16150 [Kiritimatiellaeota bacterium B1221]|nr:hypothetical protein [Kiritimatiellaeota bacterium B1221]
MKIKATGIESIRVEKWYDDEVKNSIDIFNGKLSKLEKAIKSKHDEKAKSKESLFNGTDAEIQKSIKFLTSMDGLDIFYATQIYKITMEKKELLAGVIKSCYRRRAGEISKEMKKRADEITEAHEKANIKVPNMNYVIISDETYKKNKLYADNLMKSFNDFSISEKEEVNLNDIESFLGAIG